MKKKVLIIGSGGREHALGWKIKQSPLVEKIYFAPGNAGTQELGENINIHPKQINNLLHFANEYKIDLTLVGPEAPLILGIADLFKKRGLKIIGPSKKASQIEGSKIFAKKLMTKYKIPTAAFVYFDNYQQAIKYVKQAKYPLVIKANGLCLGKGVTICNNKKEANEFLHQLMIEKIFGDAGEKVLIEECLYGQEVSVTLITDGNNFILFPLSQDHKRLLDNDQGPNTGGTGAYSPVPFVNQNLIAQIEKNIIAPTIKALTNEGCTYQGILYPGLILTDDGPKVLEYNCRFGDPETQVQLPLLKTDLLTILEASLDGSLDKCLVRLRTDSCACVVLTSKGYPGKYDKGEIIYGLNKIDDSDIQVFHAGTHYQDNKVVTNGGRVLGVTAYGKDLSRALEKAYKAIGKEGTYFKGMQFRRDIGQKAINYAMIA